MVAVAFFAEDLVQQIGAAVDDELLIGVVQRGVHTTQHFDHAEAIQSAVGVPPTAVERVIVLRSPAASMIGQDGAGLQGVGLTSLAGGGVIDAKNMTAMPKAALIRLEAASLTNPSGAAVIANDGAGLKNMSAQFSAGAVFGSGTK